MHCCMQTWDTLELLLKVSMWDSLLDCDEKFEMDATVMYIRFLDRGHSRPNLGKMYGIAMLKYIKEL